MPLKRSKPTLAQCEATTSSGARCKAKPHKNGLCFFQQFGEFVAAAGAAQANRELVADQLAATTGEDRRTAGETRPLLLAAVGREPSDEAAVRGDAGPDRAATATD